MPAAGRPFTAAPHKSTPVLDTIAGEYEEGDAKTETCDSLAVVVLPASAGSPSNPAAAPAAIDEKADERANLRPTDDSKARRSGQSKACRVHPMCQDILFAKIKTGNDGILFASLACSREGERQC